MRRPHSAFVVVATLSIAFSAPHGLSQDGPTGSGIVSAETTKLSDESQHYECKNGVGVRHIDVLATEGKAPCRVTYTKTSEGQTEPTVLWTAQNELAYCQDKASGFASKLEGMGWVCTGE